MSSMMNRRILVADDSSTIQKVIKIALGRYQAEIIEASSYVEALAAVGRSAPDVLVMDASLPGAHSPADFARLSEQAGQTPVLLLVGTYESVDETQFRSAGFQHFLKKPFESTDIVAAIDKLTLGGLSQPTSEITVAPGRQAHATVVMDGAFPGLPPEAEDRMPELALDLPGGLDIPPPPPPPAIKAEEGRRGRRAFSGPGEGSSGTLSGATDRPRGGSAVPPPPMPKMGSPGAGVSLSLDDVGADLEDKLPALVRAAVEDYCERHFKSLAREIIAGELRRLADEKARHLVDS